MELTYILVDFENVRPQDFDLLHGPQYRVKVFHGPHQNKLDMAIVKALQPLGEQVEYVQAPAVKRSTTTASCWESWAGSRARWR